MSPSQMIRAAVPDTVHNAQSPIGALLPDAILEVNSSLRVVFDEWPEDAWLGLSRPQTAGDGYGFKGIFVGPCNISDGGALLVGNFKYRSELAEGLIMDVFSSNNRVEGYFTILNKDGWAPTPLGKAFSIPDSFGLKEGVAPEAFQAAIRYDKTVAGVTEEFHYRIEKGLPLEQVLPAIERSEWVWRGRYVVHFAVMETMSGSVLVVSTKIGNGVNLSFRPVEEGQAPSMTNEISYKTGHVITTKMMLSGQLKEDCDEFTHLFTVGGTALINPSEGKLGDVVLEKRIEEPKTFTQN